MYCIFKIEKVVNYNPYLKTKCFDPMLEFGNFESPESAIKYIKEDFPDSLDDFIVMQCWKA